MDVTRYARPSRGCVRARPKSTTSLLVIVAKLPQPGRVKTRLGLPFAAELYEAMLKDLVERLCAHDLCELAVAHSPEPARRWFEQLGDGTLTLIDQGWGDLGQRQCHIVREALSKGYEQVLLTGGDVPTLPAHVIRSGIAALAAHDVVLGPCTDGGYYLIGLKRELPMLFKSIAWGTEHVFAAMLNRVQTGGLSLHCLPLWYDIDRPQDLNMLMRRRARIMAPRTAALLQRSSGQMGDDASSWWT